MLEIGTDACIRSGHNDGSSIVVLRSSALSVVYEVYIPSCKAHVGRGLDTLSSVWATPVILEHGKAALRIQTHVSAFDQLKT